MTPCEERGYKVGQTFRYKYGGNMGAFSIGSVVRLYHDNGTFAPLFKLVSGSTPYKNADGDPGAYISVSHVVPYDPAKLSTRVSEVSPAWIRLPATAILTPFVLATNGFLDITRAAIKSVRNTWENFVVPCWKGPDQ